MKIHRAKADAKSYQWIMPSVQEDDLLDLLTFDCEAKSQFWVEANWYCFNPKQKKGNFYTLGSSSSFAFDKEVYESNLFPLLEMAGEILPIQLGMETLYVMNILECVNTLNDEKTDWETYPDGSRRKISNYYFHNDRISESSLFKIPQTSKTEILTYSGVKDPEDEFKSLYEKLNFSGLIFERL